MNVIAYNWNFTREAFSNGVAGPLFFRVYRFASFDSFGQAASSCDKTYSANKTNKEIHAKKEWE